MPAKVQMDKTANSTGTLEQFLKGEPLTDELAALKRGEEPSDDEFRSSVSAPSPFTAEQPLDDDDREHLRRFKSEPGWNVMMRLLDSDIRHQENLAKAASKSDPLGNREQVANFWAYVSMLEKSKSRMIWLIDEEIAKLGV